MLDRLVGGAVLAEADRVVGPHVGDRQLHERRQPDGGAHVVGEHEERAAVDPGAAVQGDAVHHRAHAVLADAEVQHPAVDVAGEVLGGLLLGRKDGSPFGVVLLEPARSAEPPHSSGSTGGDRAESTSPDALRVATPFSSAGNDGSASSQPVGRRAGAHPVEQLVALPVALAPRRRSTPATRPRPPCRARRAPRVCSRTSGATSKVCASGRSRGSSWSPRPRRRPARSRAPCRCPARSGAGQAITVFRAMKLGRSVTAAGLLQGVPQRLDVLLVPGAAVGPVEVVDVPAVGARSAPRRPR